MKIKIIFVFLIFIVSFSEKTLCDSTLGNIYLIGTGGTIAGNAPSAVSSEYQPGVLKEHTLLQNIPELAKVANIKTLDLFQIDSADISMSQWLTLAKTVNELLNKNDVAGVVITHGTDTLEETAYFLNLVVKSQKPIVLVGAMRASSSLSGDGPLNLFNAIKVASSADAKGKGVLVVINDQIFDARDVTKTNTTRVDAFKSLNTGPIGLVNFGLIHFYKTSLRRNTINTEFNISDLKSLPRVEIIYEYAGTDGRLFSDAIKHGVEGVVFAGTGDGNIAKSERDLLKLARDKGIIIVRSSRTGSGYVTYNYVHDLDSKLGLIPADDLNPQKARILLMLALTKTHDPALIKKYFSLY